MFGGRGVILCATVNRTERLLDLIALLVNARRPVPFEEIRQAFPEDYGEGTIEAARRKFERDKRELLEVGVPLEYVPPEADDLDAGEDEGGYVVDRKRAFLPALALDADEMAFLYLVGLSTASDPGFPYRDEMQLALGKLELGAGVSPKTVSAPARLYVDRSEGPRPADAEMLRERVALLEDAVRRGKRVRFEYAALSTGQASAREVDPYGLFWRRGRWSLVGFSHERNAVRVFLLHRMQAPTVNAQKPGTPDFEVPATFRLADHLRVPAWRHEVEPPTVVALDVAADYAWMAEREFGVVAEPARDGWRRVRLETTNSDAVVGWVLGLGAHACVRSPEPVRARVKAALRRLLEAAST